MSLTRTISRLLFFAALISPIWARAQQATYWTGSNGANWLSPGNWSNGLPEADSALPSLRWALIGGNPNSGPLLTGYGTEASAHYMRVGYRRNSDFQLLTGTLNITDSALLRTNQPSFIATSEDGTLSGANGTVNVNHAYWQANKDITIGDSAVGTLNVTNGGWVGTTFSLVGNHVSGTGNILVDGSNSIFQLGQGLVVGVAGNATMTIQNGGRVSSEHGYIARDGGSASVVVDNGTWENWNGDLTMGTSSSLTVRNGGTVSNQNGYIGKAGGSSANVTVNNGTWTNTGSLNMRSGGSLSIQNGGTVSVGGGTGTLTISNTSGDADVTISSSSSRLLAGTIDGGSQNSGRRLLTINQNSHTYVFSPNVTGALGTDIQGNGTVIVTGNWTNTGDGSTGIVNRVRSGTLQLGNGGTTGTVTGNVLLHGSSGVLAFNRSQAVTFGMNISNFSVSSDAVLSQRGTGAVTLTGSVDPNLWIYVDNGAGNLTISSEYDFAGQKLGDGTLVLTGGGQFGSAYINQGTVKIGNGGVASAYNGSLDLSGVLAIDSSNDLTLSLDVAGSGDIRKLGGNTVTLTGYHFDHVGDTEIVAGTIAFQVPALVGETWRSSTSGNGSFKKEGAGILTFDGHLRHTGGTTINGGRLILGNKTISGNIQVSSGAIVELRGSSIAGNITGGGEVLAASGSTELTGQLSYTGATSGAGFLTIDSTQNSLLSGNFSVGSFVKRNTGTLTFTGAVTAGDSSSFQISGGTVKIGNSGTSGSLSGGLLLNGGSLEFARSDDVSYSGNISTSGSGGTLIQSGAGKLTYTGTSSSAALVSAGTLEIGNGGTTGWISGAITNNSALIYNLGGTLSYSTSVSGSGSIAKRGAGHLSLAGSISANSLSVQAGTLAILGSTEIAGTASVSPGGADVSTLAVNGGTLTVNQIAEGSGSGTLSFNGGTLRARLNQANFLTGFEAGDVTIQSGGLTIDSNSRNIGIAVNLGGPGELRKISPGTLTLSGTNSHGSTRLEAGVLSIASSAALGSGALTITGGRLQTTGGEITFTNPLTLSGNFSLARRVNLNGPITLTQSVTVTADNPIVLAGNFQSSFGGAIGGNFGITFTEGSIPTGTIKLSGNNTYTGATSIQAGRVVIDGSVVGNVSVAAAGELGGAGRIGGIISGAGEISPGNSPGILSAASLDPTGGADLNFEFTLEGSALWNNAANSGNDVLHLTSGITAPLTAANTINVYFDEPNVSFIGGFFIDGGSDTLTSHLANATFAYYLLNNASGTVSYNGNLYSPYGGYTDWTVARVEDAAFASGSADGYALVVTVPEPSSLGLIALGLLTHFGRRRRQS